MYVVMEFCEGGDLKALIRENIQKGSYIDEQII